MGATRRRLILVALVVFGPFAATAVKAESSYVGNAGCAGCHEQATTDWTDSHHDLAMQEATPKTVLGDFNNATFDYFGVTTTFSQRGDAFFIETDNAAGELETYPVEYVFGVEPLQQYLLPLGNGRLQALSVATVSSIADTFVVGTRKACADSLPARAGRMRSMPTAKPVSTGMIDCEDARVLRKSVW